MIFRKIVICVGIMFSLCVLCGLVSFWYLCMPTDKYDKAPVSIEIPKGVSAYQIAKILKQEGVIRSILGFLFLCKITGSEYTLKANIYTFNRSLSLFEIFKYLKKGMGKLVKITIPPGYTIKQIAKLLQHEGIIKNKEEFISLAHDRFLIANLGIWSFSLEGYLFPTVYLISPKTSSEELLSMMVQKYKEVVLNNSEYQRRAQAFGLSMHEVLTLASIIEEETKNRKEKRLISAVFHNRLKQGMRLESDPTVIYALGERFDGNLRKKDMKVRSPFNTYLYPRLPPSPISNPSLETIEAVLHPANVDYLFFVSKNDGTHAFATNFDEHKQNVFKYQILPMKKPPFYDNKSN